MTTGRINQGAAFATVRRGCCPRLGAPQLPGRGDPPRGEPSRPGPSSWMPEDAEAPRAPRVTVLVQAAANAEPSRPRGTVRGPRAGGRCCATRFRTVLRDMYETLSEVARLPLAPTDKAGLPSRVPAPHMDPSRPTQNSVRRQSHLTVRRQSRSRSAGNAAVPVHNRPKASRAARGGCAAGPPRRAESERLAAGDERPRRLAPRCANCRGRSRRVGPAKDVDREAKTSIAAQKRRSPIFSPILTYFGKNDELRPNSYSNLLAKRNFFTR